MDEGKMHMKWIIRTFRDRPVPAAQLEVRNTGKEDARIIMLHPLAAD